jgi:catechol 2,3-dioxygenase-like lactoylglutathione lyase family enzyme
MAAVVPTIAQTVIDCPNPRELAEFYRRLYGMRYRPGDEPPPAGEPDPKGDDWLVLRGPDGVNLAFQRVADLPRATWPDGPHPQMMHLDTHVRTTDDLIAVRDRAVELGAEVIFDRFDDPDEPLYVFADPAGHPLCIFVG